LELKLFDVTPYQNSGPRIVRAIQSRLLAGPAVARLNRDIVGALGERRFEALWIDKGTWVFPETLELARKLGVRWLVHYTPDPAFYVHTSRHFRASVPLYDLCVTTKRYELDLYRQAGAREVVFTWQGIDERFVRIKAAGAIAGPQRDGLVFIGHHEPYRQSILGALARAGLPLRIYGPRWREKTRRARHLGPFVKGGAVSGDTYVAILATGKIGIGLLSKLCPDDFTTRTFEIPAAGALLIAEDTAAHRELFEEGVEAEFFTTPEELASKARFYLCNEEARTRIAQRARIKVLENFTWRRSLQPVIEAIRRS
jgi:hypothetical protein